MKQHSFLTAIALLAALVLSACSGPKLSEAQIATMIGDMTASVQKRDADALVSHFMPDATISLNLPQESGGVMNLTPSEYKSLLVAGWNAQSNYSYDVSDIRIVVAADGQTASVTDTVKESVSMFGQTMTATTSEQISVVMHDGAPRISSLTAHVR